LKKPCGKPDTVERRELDVDPAGLEGAGVDLGLVQEVDALRLEEDEIGSGTTARRRNLTLRPTNWFSSSSKVETLSWCGCRSP